MSTEKSADEQPKANVANSVVTEKRQYFVPAHGVSVSARDVNEAVTKAKKAKTAEASADSAEKEGDD